MGNQEAILERFVRLLGRWCTGAVTRSDTRVSASYGRALAVYTVHELLGLVTDAGDLKVKLRPRKPEHRVVRPKIRELVAVMVEVCHSFSCSTTPTRLRVLILLTHGHEEGVVSLQQERICHYSRAGSPNVATANNRSEHVGSGNSLTVFHKK